MKAKKDKEPVEPLLWNRGTGNRQNWYLRLPIPKPLREQWPRKKGGNAPIVVIRPLNTDSLAAANAMSLWFFTGVASLIVCPLAKR